MDCKLHNFWDTQPIVSEFESPTLTQESGPIIEINEAKTDELPARLPDGLLWAEYLNDYESKAFDVQDIYMLLANHYVEDQSHTIRFEYSAEFLKWALFPPNHWSDMIVGIQISKPQKKLIAMVTGIPVRVMVDQKQCNMMEINFLCVHKEFRNIGLAPILIKEITRRAFKHGYYYATFTAGKVFAKPMSTTQYYHRLLNPKKLVDIGFCCAHPRITMNSMIKLYRVHDQPITVGWRKMVATDVPKAFELFQQHICKYRLFPIFTEDEFAYWFLPRDDIMFSFVVEDENKHITDLISFFCIESRVLHHRKHSHIRAGYFFYEISGQTPLRELKENALSEAKRANIDVMNALTVMKNDPTLLMELKFHPGTGQLHYYLFNWRCAQMSSSDVGFMLL